ncbi:hypothetical protein ERX27_02485 [Macrococcus brunensis]|uniref:Putative endonuclease Z1 domain-containing protein n=2 Tax=Macrococcus brunensis TaxID=198483 RepID=A0A4R6BG15_9STAP|nr:hypothetical protein ERX27_02485 [Macrococcus brunensis]
MQQGEITEDLWVHLVDEIHARHEKVKVVKLGDKIRNDAKIPGDYGSSWQLYKKSLEQKGLSENSILNIEKSSFSILQHLSMDTSDSGPTKGLVIGNVQSGKTANMAGLMAMAADNGFNVFIILSGVIENLRQQTATRLYNDMTPKGSSNLQWQTINQPSPNSRLPEHNISSYNLEENGKKRYFTVVLKNKKRLENLIKWLLEDEKKAKQMKILVIDDEADQASVNTLKIEEEDRTAINRLIKELVHSSKFGGMNYISYTATPYANVLNETTIDSLYPKDFIISLEPSEDYIGPKQIFGMEEPEAVPTVNIIREISDADAALIREIQNEDLGEDIPRSFKQSIQWFVLTVATMRYLEYKNPISMLVHTSFKIIEHQIIADKIEQYVKYMKENYEDTLKELRELYENEKIEFKRNYFLRGMKDYSTPDQVPDYPLFEEIKPELDFIFRLNDNELISHIPIGESGAPKYHKGFHLAIDNSKSQADQQIVRLVYPDKKQMPDMAPAFIVVGGNTLSRGLTLEGLTSTYFLRTTNQADTLMQMGRWFGYRKGYELFPRVWLENIARERFEFLSQMNEELREDVAEYAVNGKSPSEFGPKIKNSYKNNLIKITSNNKMQAAVGAEFDFTGFNSQTIYFEKNVNKLEHNLSLTKSFLNSLPKPEISSNKMIFRDIDKQVVHDYLKNYQVCEKDIQMSCIPALMDWIEENNDLFNNWNIIYSYRNASKNQQNADLEWQIQGENPGANIRTKLTSRSNEEIANIGALRTPADLVADTNYEGANISSTKDVYQIREQAGLSTVPQLIIYKLDKDQRTKKEYLADVNKESSRREPLNFPVDIIGLNIMIPGIANSDTNVKYVTAHINLSSQSVEEEVEED